LKNQFGAIEAANIRGPLDAETSYALLDARDISGTVKLATSLDACMSRTPARPTSKRPMPNCAPRKSTAMRDW
jgi:hypothetical protein